MSPRAIAVATAEMSRTWFVRLDAIWLTAEAAFDADVAREARHLVGEARQLIDHDVDGVLELEDLALRVDGDLSRQVASRDSRRHLCDVADLVRQVARHAVDVVGQLL